MTAHQERRKSSPADPLAEIAELTERALNETEDALTERKQLTGRFLREIEKEIAEAKRMLGLLGDHWKHGEQSLPYEQFRHALDRAITARTKDRRAELLRDWKDRVTLLERRLALMRESAALEQQNETDK
jgi:Mg2+ and Co2+ transporter CorA